MEIIRLIDYEDFLIEVRGAYVEAGSPKEIRGWYTDEYEKHKGKWPHDPHKTYSKEGWENYNRMVGKTN